MSAKSTPPEVGTLFGELTFVREASAEEVAAARGNRRKVPGVYWVLTCSCGVSATITRRSVVTGNTKTCGHGKGKGAGAKPGSYYLYKGEQRSIPELAVIAGVTKTTMWRRLTKYHMDVDTAVSTVHFHTERKQQCHNEKS